MFEKLEFPNRITVELTNRCNVSCTFCPRQTTNMELGDMDFHLYKKIIDEAAEHLPVKLVIFFRGESLLYPKLEEAILYAKEKGLGPIQLSSNALVLDDKAADMLIRCQVDFISFSLDTLDERIYKESRLQGDLSISMRHVIALSEKCKKIREDNTSSPQLQVSTIEIPVYKKCQQEFIDFWLKYVDIVRVYYEHDDKGHFVDKNVKKMMLNCNNRKPCRKIFTDFLIYWNGKIALCNYDWSEGSLNHNVYQHSISEIWNSEEYAKIRKMHEENNFEKEIQCADCHHWKIDYVEGGFLGKLFKVQ